MYADTTDGIKINDNLTVTGSLVNGTTNILTTLTNKANTTETFLKPIINNDVYLTLSANKRITVTSDKK